MKYYRPTVGEPNVDRIFHLLCKDMLTAPAVNTGHWQAKRDTPMSESRELQNVVLEFPVPATPGAWAGWMKPHLPWAEDHFAERVSGTPHNPPPSHKYWPHNREGNKDHMDGQVFSHSYPERMWPRYAPEDKRKAMQSTQSATFGLRYPYGDLNHAIDLLVQEPYTRQCFIPIWFPEDLYAAAVEHQRVPCTLGYHVMLRDNRLHVFYPMRSLDVLRYLRDDAYMAGRLTHWLIRHCQRGSNENSVWHDAVPGTLTMHAVSCHVFEGDLSIIRVMLQKSQKVAAAA